MKTRNLPANRRHEGGMATIIFIVLVTIMVILLTANIRCLIQLHRETQLLEKQQIKRLAGAATNMSASPLPQASP